MVALRLTWLFALGFAFFLQRANTCKGTDASAQGSGGPKTAAPAETGTLPKGVDASTLTARERRELAAQLHELIAPCPDTPVPLAQCIAESRACKACMPAAQFLVKLVQAGRPKKEREEAYQLRFSPNKTKTIVTDGSPDMGPPDAVVTIVEWADFQCPTCAMMAPLLEDFVKRYNGQVRLVYKFYPLESHKQGEPAARAAFAAMQQGKFWEMHHALFENQMSLDANEIERLAKGIGLKIDQFRQDMASKETTERLQKDKKQADELGLDGTPFIFINGRRVELSMLSNPLEELDGWVRLDIELAGKTPAGKPLTVLSAAPDAGAAPTASASVAPAATGAASAGPAPSATTNPKTGNKK